MTTAGGRSPAGPERATGRTPAGPARATERATERAPACPVCEAERPALLVPAAAQRDPATARPWYRCAACASLFSWPPPARAALATHLEAMAYGQAALADQISRDKEPLFAQLLARLAAARPPGRRLLDVGCSFGGFLERARAAGYEPTGVEPNPVAAAAAAARGFAVTRAFGLAEAGLAPASVDVVTSIDVLYYAARPLDELRATARVLAPGGVLAIRTTNKADLGALAALALRVTPRAEPGFRAAVHDHLNSVPPRALRAALARAGFTDVAVEGGATTIPLARAGLRTRLAYGVSHALARATGGRVELSPGVLVLARRAQTPAADLASPPPPAL